MTDLRLGPPTVYVPVCVRWPWGFCGGPIGYVKRPIHDACVETIIMIAKQLDKEGSPQGICE